MFQFTTFALPRLYIHRGVTGVHPVEFPHSEISGSTLVYQLPGAYRRLPRLSSALVPRHPPVCSYLSYSLKLYISTYLGRRVKTILEVADKRRFSFTRHFLQHVAFRTRDVRYAVFKEQAPHPGPALAKALGCVAHLSVCVRSKLNSAREILRSHGFNANRPRRVILACGAGSGAATRCHSCST